MGEWKGRERGERKVREMGEKVERTERNINDYFAGKGWEMYRLLNTSQLWSNRNLLTPTKTANRSRRYFFFLFFFFRAVHLVTFYFLRSLTKQM
jgi:hypothetical protein